MPRDSATFAMELGVMVISSGPCGVCGGADDDGAVVPPLVPAEAAEAHWDGVSPLGVPLLDPVPKLDSMNVFGWDATHCASAITRDEYGNFEIAFHWAFVIPGSRCPLA